MAKYNDPSEPLADLACSWPPPTVKKIVSNTAKRAGTQFTILFLDSWGEAERCKSFSGIKNINRYLNLEEKIWMTLFPEECRDEVNEKVYPRCKFGWSVKTKLRSSSDAAQ
ncbi:hypothetical protein WA026_006148 [Henosepilachna vigintioctopunctata]|uniref:Uncharacterized protein n=1 Tax=Henosepilachna vigintioctopunctata TaxID=420089 RepID=A0AAW1TP02_9CUCU